MKRCFRPNDLGYWRFCPSLLAGAVYAGVRKYTFSHSSCLLDCSAIVLHRLDKDASAYLLAMIMPGKEVCKNGRCRFNLKIQETYYVVTKATLGKDKSTLPYSVNLVEVYSGMGQSEKGFYSEERKMWNECFVSDDE